MSKRELDVLNQVFVVPVRPNEAISEALHLSTGRVKNILTDLFRKFEVNTRHELSLEARRRGYHPEQRTPVIAPRTRLSPLIVSPPAPAKATPPAPPEEADDDNWHDTP
jgi:DNA-binding CsgD family transcriptional regulator